MSNEREASKRSPSDKAKLETALKELIAKQNNSICTHELWESAAEHALSSISLTEPGCITMLVGPPGVGKSTLLASLDEMLRDRLATGSKSEVPVISTEMVTNPNGPFSWKDFYHRILPQINSPFAEDVENHPSNLSVPGKNATVDVLRRVFEKSAKLRNTQVLLVDEAHHIALGRMAKGLIEQLEYLKSLANTSKVHLILAGPYYLLGSMELSGQLARRTTVVHFTRYTIDEIGAFRDALCMMADDFSPWTFDLDLEHDRSVAEYFFNRSVGCIGILRPWLLRAVERASRFGSWVVTKEDLDTTAKGAKWLNLILNEITEGEKTINGSSEDWAILESNLSGNGRGGPQFKHATNGKGGRKLLPGEAAPRRYPTGGQQ